MRRTSSVSVARVDWLRQICVCLEFVGFNDILLRFRTREDDNRDVREVSWPFAEFSEQFVAVLPGEIEVKQDDVRLGCVGVLPALMEKVERFDPISHDVECVRDATLPEGFLGESNVAVVVLDEEYLCFRIRHSLFRHWYHLLLAKRM
jgi:hypothetical protein